MTDLPRLIAFAMAWLLLFLSSLPSQAAEMDNSAPLVIGNRTIHVFRVPLGAFSPAERAEGARRRIERAFELPGEGWTSVVQANGEGMQVMLDNRPLFVVLPGDASTLAAETPQDLANQASKRLQQAWRESRERSDMRATLDAMLRSVLASALLAAGLWGIIASRRRAQGWLRQHWLAPLAASLSPRLGRRLVSQLPLLVSRLCGLLAWLLGVCAVFFYLTYTLSQFVLTRPAGETLFASIRDLIVQALTAVAEAIPGMFIAVLIFLLAWLATRLANELFANLKSNSAHHGLLTTDTAPATRRIVHTLLWLFAIAMAYPYLPGSHTEAFKGLSVIVGLMMSVGTSGLVSQVTSGVILVYTHALKVGEYVRIQEHEGTVTDLGLFVTRLRTGLGEEVALPNALVLANVTRNFSRSVPGQGFVLDVKVSIGYDTPWRQVHAMLLQASASVAEIADAPAPYVVQAALSDFYVGYTLVVYVNSVSPSERARVASDLHAAIQDVFNAQGVAMLSPHYVLDPNALAALAASGISTMPRDPLRRAD